MNKTVVALAVLLAAAVVFGYQAQNKASYGEQQALYWYRLAAEYKEMAGIGDLKSVHSHADFKVYIDGKAIDFAQEKYVLKALSVHLEDMNGNVLHKHATGVTFGHFFSTLGFDLNSCLSTDDGRRLCDEGEKTLKVTINGKKVDPVVVRSYDLQNEDKILVSYGSESESELDEQYKSITDYAHGQEDTEKHLGDANE